MAIAYIAPLQQRGFCLMCKHHCDSALGVIFSALAFSDGSGRTSRSLQGRQGRSDTCLWWPWLAEPSPSFTSVAVHAPHKKFPSMSARRTQRPRRRSAQRHSSRGRASNGASCMPNAAHHSWQRCHLSGPRTAELVAAETGVTCGDGVLEVRGLGKASGGGGLGLEKGRSRYA
jgi:hypothetical protein